MTNNINHELKTRSESYAVIWNHPRRPGNGRPDAHPLPERMMTNVRRRASSSTTVSAMTRLESGADMIAVESVNMHDLVYQIEYDLPANNLAGRWNSVRHPAGLRGHRQLQPAQRHGVDSSKFGSLFGRSRNTST